MKEKVQMKEFCPNCEKETEQVLLKHVELIEIKSEIIPVEVEYIQCNECNEEFLSPSSKSDPLRSAYDEYRRRKDMVTPQEIKFFREKFNLTQRELSDLVGFGGATLSRYENGALQDETHNNLLRLIMESDNLLKVINNKPEVLSPEKSEVISTIFQTKNTFVDYINDFLNPNKFDIFSGNRPLDILKVSETIKFFTYNREVFKTKLFKLLFYSDFRFFNSNHLSITGLKYARLPFGPVPDNFQLILGLVTSNDSTIVIEQRSIKEFEGEIIKSLTPPNINSFTESEKSTLIEINSRFGNLSSKEISLLSHKEKGYIETKTGSLISYSYAESILN
jgi:putative zinc finger/helix-turn-helix YgiT family protein